MAACYQDFYPFELMDDVFHTGMATNDPDDLQAGDALIVHGGADIHPSLYNKGRSRHSGAYNEPSRRDLIEWSLMQRAKELEMPILGICRGAQMLCALAGGYLYQHVDGHSGYHPVVTHDGKTILVNSIHHQMMAINETNHELIAWMPQPLSGVHFDVDTNVPVAIEPEFVYFPDVKGFAVQWHPEMMEDTCEANVYFMNFIRSKLSDL